MIVWLFSAALAASLPQSLGITLGETDLAGARAALAGANCREEPSPRRPTVHFVCAGGSLPYAEVRVVLADGGPVHFVSARHDLPTGPLAAKAYTDALTALSAANGAPAKSTVPTAEARWDAAVVRYVSGWTLEKHSVQLSLLAVGGGPFQVTERWEIPGVEASLPPKAGLAPIHGAPAAPRKNPHILD